ncbi:valine--tRNA ligase [Limisalsivibrio acetivorans]|uniref:valine--tRNA ligase n=1 Tax=Limisalsivibrio acetivorans TaxID=1304888 RepID=UPI0003B65EEF|nr:valine--tRNA ligase [Limisalsivibrio acetivorans]
MSRDIPTRIDPAEYESEIYKKWLDEKKFHADETSDKPPYSIVIPPPNVTGSLHMGHALNNTLQDVLIRFHRMDGYESLWMPGTDHAGIATQNVVEKQLAAEGKSRHDIGREEFIRKVWQWKEESGGQIINQLKRLGCSCDWERERFTMDDGLSDAVRKVFVTLYNEDLIYRSDYIVNWCPRCHTALSDLEVEHEDLDGAFYHIYYPVKGSNERLVVATTRPETMLGDTAVAVHPEDERYAHLIGGTVILPLMEREIPIIADEYVDMEKGTGALKVTPAHDPNDFEIGRRHDLETLSVMDDSGVINENGGRFSGLDRFDARKQIVQALEGEGLFHSKEPVKHSVGHCYRCKTVVEPAVSKQWFVKIKPMAEMAIKGVESEDIKIYPENWKKTYYEWMYNIRDWCISRQIWWGHRIPAWYCESCGRVIVSMDDPDNCPDCGSDKLEQDSDVLDTWFSSALWPFSTMGWPEQTKTLEKFYPTSCLVTGFDILFFWVARMIMSGYKFMDEKPFKEVYLHALVRDEHGQKMSKSKGNVIDPLVIIDKYGADAFRFTLTAFAAQGRDIKLSEDRIEGYRNFLNKIWNASRFIMMNLDKENEFPAESELELEDKWILDNLRRTAEQTAEAIRTYDFNEAAGSIYQFFWHQFCDWYIEFIKPRIYSDERKGAALGTAKYVLEKSLAILHPFMPFVTEHIFRMLTGKDSIMNEEWPVVEYTYTAEAEETEYIIEFISMVRNIRGEYNVPPASRIEAMVKTSKPELKDLFKRNESLIMNLARLESLGYTDTDPENAASNIAGDFEVFVPLAGLIDVDAEIKKLEKEKKAAEKDLKVYGGKLQNEGYLSKAPEHVIEKDRKKLAETEALMEKINENLERLKKLC